MLLLVFVLLVKPVELVNAVLREVFVFLEVLVFTPYIPLVLFKKFVLLVNAVLRLVLLSSKFVPASGSKLTI